MIFFTLKGEVIHIYDIKTLYSTFNEVQYFQKQNIILQTETENYTITFVDRKIDLLEDIKIGNEVELEIKVKGRIWSQNGNQYSANELVCLKLKKIQPEISIAQITYKDSVYDVRKYYFGEHLRMKMVNASDNSEIDFSAVCDFMYESESVDHILFSNMNDNQILNILVRENILEPKYDIHQSGAASGSVCKILI